MHGLCPNYQEVNLNNCEQSSLRRLERKLPTLQAINQALAFNAFRHFVPLLWPVVEKRPFVPGWHIDAICDHLEAVFYGFIRNIIINIPPRFTKSLLVSVFWPMWCWLHKAEMRFLRSSYTAPLSIRDNVKSRRLFQSNPYQELLMSFNPDLVLMGDQNEKIRFENCQRGYSLATSVDGALTGEGGDVILVDDPHNVREGESETKRNACLSWWDESMSSRLDDSKTGAKVIIMQRVHQEDLTGHLLEREKEEWDLLCLPMEYEGQNRVKSSIGFRDPRTHQGQLLCPERMGTVEVESLKKSLGSYATAGQLQQRPAPRGGGMIKVAEFRIVGVINPTKIISIVRYWDKAGTEGAGARTAGVLMLLMADEQVVIADVVKGQWSAGSREKRIQQVAIMDAEEYGRDRVDVWLEQEPGSGGKESAENTIRNLRGFSVHKETVTGDKVTRARPFSAYVEAGCVSLLQGPWVREYMDECEQFPFGSFKDQVDGSSGAFNKLKRLDSEEKEAGTWGKKK